MATEDTSQLKIPIIQKNQSRGREGKPPVTYTECMDIATRVLAANKVGSYFSQEVPHMIVLW